jgi:hypothetical protein
MTKLFLTANYNQSYSLMTQRIRLNCFVVKFKQTYFKSHCLYNVSWFPKVVLSGSGSEIVGWSLVTYGVWSRIKSLELYQ